MITAKIMQIHQSVTNWVISTKLFPFEFQKRKYPSLVCATAFNDKKLVDLLYHYIVIINAKTIFCFLEDYLDPTAILV